MVASLPSCDPPLIRTTRPTSTSLQTEALISASPILLIVVGLKVADFVSLAILGLAIECQYGTLDVGKIQASPSEFPRDNCSLARMTQRDKGMKAS
jgi:hypothetical protein